MTAVRPSSAWSGPCDVVIRRHPKSGYLVDIIGSGAHAALAWGFYSMAKHYASQEREKQNQPANPDDPLCDPPLTRDQAMRLAAVLRQSNVLVDDRVLAVDERISEWMGLGVVLLVGGFIAGAFLSEHVSDLWSPISMALLLIIGGIVGAWLRHIWEQDPAMLPAPWSAGLRVVGLIAAFVGFFGYIAAVTWTSRRFPGWPGLLLILVGSLAMALILPATVLLAQRIKDKMTKPSA